MWQKKRLKRCFSGRRLIALLFAVALIGLFVAVLAFLHLPFLSPTLFNTVGEDESFCGGFGRSLHARHFAENGGNCCKCSSWRSKFNSREEEERIFQSVRREHTNLVAKLEEVQERLNTITKQIPVKEAELRELQLRVEELKLLRKEYSDKRNVQLRLPHQPLHLDIPSAADEQRCSISNPSMPLLLYPLLPSNSTKNVKLDQFASLFHHHFGKWTSITHDAQRACLFVAIVTDGIGRLGHFGIAGGQNHLLIDLTGGLRPSQVGSALLVSANLTSLEFRPSVDFAVHLDVPDFDPNKWQSLPQLLPAIRPYFVHFVAKRSLLSTRQLSDLSELTKSLDSSQDTHLIDLHNCSYPFCPFDREERMHLLRQSTFTLLFPELPLFQQQFYECLEAGSIPVVCSLHAPLPFDDLINWRLAAVRVAPARFSEVHFLLRSIPIADLIELKRKGRFFFEHYLSDAKVLTRAILTAIRSRIQLPGEAHSEPPAEPLYFSNNWTYPFFISTFTKPPYDDEYLGPIEFPLESPSYVHNFTSLFLYSDSLWNDLPMAIGHSPRFLPNAHFLPSDAEFGDDTAFGMRPIEPGSGQQFSLALGGNRPREQFTIVIVTFNREQVLLNTLERLNNLPYLNRIIVIWNDIGREPSLTAWPRLHVPLHFVNGSRNSLNNRFIPFREIETEAVLSMDDDIDLKQHEIVFAFRVWREHRDRIVGFPARYHARFGSDNFYNSNHTCQYSMILTGAAIIHKFYLYAYTYHMPEVIRHKVDEWMNCEDLAMNFLVAHLTRKAPIKTTSKWTLRCPACPEMLSNVESHFVERHECIRFLIRVYGYNPLVFTQFRADSVLFKTRVPPNHQKCFRFV